MMKERKVYQFPTYWTDKLKIEFLQRTILIHSYIYYELNSNIWTDKHFDEVAKQLVELQNIYSKSWLDRTQYGYVFYDFDGTTGFDLWNRLTMQDRAKITGIAGRILLG